MMDCMHPKSENSLNANFCATGSAAEWLRFPPSGRSVAFGVSNSDFCFVFFFRQVVRIYRLPAVSMATRTVATPRSRRRDLRRGSRRNCVWCAAIGRPVITTMLLPARVVKVGLSFILARRLKYREVLLPDAFFTELSLLFAY